MKLMPSRYSHIIQAIMGYNKIRIPLIEFDGNNFCPSVTADDLGIYVIIPKIAHILHLSADNAINVFFYGILIFSGLIGFLGFLALYKSLSERIIASAGLVLLMIFSARAGDVYLAYMVCAVSLIPWCLYFEKNGKFSYFFMFYMFFGGLAISFFNFIRAYSSFGVFIFIAILLGFSRKFTAKQKLLMMILMLFGTSLPIAYFKYAYNQYKTYATQYFPKNPLIMKNHVLWHNTYLGFSFLNIKNPENIQYDDNYAAAKAQLINPGVINNSPEYEETLKQEIIRLIKHHPVFIIFTIFAKIGILLLYLLIFANIGLLCAILYRKPWHIEGAFLGSLLFNSIFPLLTLPFSEYSLGFITTAALYGIVSINEALQKKDR
jgi:hypothetical protein